jgi:hypothetical protein
MVPEMEKATPDGSCKSLPLEAYPSEYRASNGKAVPATKKPVSDKLTGFAIKL